MRYELSDYEWTAIKPMLPNKPRGVRRVNDRRVLNGIFWVLRSGAPWRDLPATYGPRTTCYNLFVRWRQAGVWDQIMGALAAGHDTAVQMIDTSVVRVHQHGACISDNNHQDMGRSRGGLTSKIHAVVDTNGLPVHLALTPARRMITECVHFSSAPCLHRRCCSRIAATTPAGSGNLLASKEHRRTFLQNEIAKIRSASARICITRATWSSGSSTRSSRVGVSRPDMTNSRSTIWRSSNSHQSEFGCALMSPRPYRIGWAALESQRTWPPSCGHYFCFGAAAPRRVLVRQPARLPHHGDG
ncbi:transposase [Bradyrhizobium sp. AZCC 2230]